MNWWPVVKDVLWRLFCLGTVVVGIAIILQYLKPALFEANDFIQNNQRDIAVLLINKETISLISLLFVLRYLILGTILTTIGLIKFLERKR